VHRQLFSIHRDAQHRLRLAGWDSPRRGRLVGRVGRVVLNLALDAAIRVQKDGAPQELVPRDLARAVLVGLDEEFIYFLLEVAQRACGRRVGVRGTEGGRVG